MSLHSFGQTFVAYDIPFDTMQICSVMHQDFSCVQAFDFFYFCMFMTRKSGINYVTFIVCKLFLENTFFLRHLLSYTIFGKNKWRGAEITNVF